MYADTGTVSYTHLDVYKRQGQGDVHAASVVEVDEVDVEEKFGCSVLECASENDLVCEVAQTPSVSSVEDSEERKQVSGRPGEQPEDDEDVQCSDGGSGRDGDDADDERVYENEIGEEVDEEIGEEQLEVGEEVQCNDVDLDYGDEEGEIVEEKKVEAEELEAVSYTHLDVYKRQVLTGFL